MSSLKSPETSLQFFTASALSRPLPPAAEKRFLYAAYFVLKWTAAVFGSLVSTEVIWSYPLVLIDPGVWRYAFQLHSRSFDVIGVPSSQTAFGFRWIVRV